MAYFFLEDSPRNLMVHNEKEKAGNVLKHYIGRELTPAELDSIQYNIVNSGENKHHSSAKADISQLFTKRVRNFLNKK